VVTQSLRNTAVTAAISSSSIADAHREYGFGDRHQTASATVSEPFGIEQSVLVSLAKRKTSEPVWRRGV